jgi:NAD(P)H-dependent FMN reductase
MNIVIISASMRTQSQSLKVSEWLARHSETLGITAEVLDLHTFKLPMFDDGETAAENQVMLREKLTNADAYVFVSPEWNGMMSHGLINMLHFVGQEMAYKPVMLVGVSAGRGGTYPVAQMKQLGGKNRHYIISPENLVVSGVESAFNTPEIVESEADFAIKNRADYSLKVLIELAGALTHVRSGSVIDLKNFSNGM